MDPNQMVEANGEPITVEYVADAEFDTDYNLDEEASTIEEFDSKAIVSNPSRETERRMEGIGVRPRYELTVPSGADINPDRQGRPDRIEVRGETTQVVDEQFQTHPLTGTEKKTVVVSGLDEGV